MEIIKDKKITRGKKIKFLYYLFSFKYNFPVFCRFFLPQAFTKEFGKFHIEIINDFMKPKNSAVAASRGHGKSTLIGQGFVLWQLFYGGKHYIVYTSQNHTKSVEFLDPIKYELKNNPLLKFVYGAVNIKSVKDKETKKDREDCFDYSKTRIQALSFEKNIRGMKYKNYRPDLIILDDIEDDERVLNPLLRDKDANKLNKQIIPAMDPEIGHYKMIGTILHHDSLLVKKLQLLNGKIYRACEIVDNRIVPNSILFPALYTEEILMEKRREMGSVAFESEYLNNPVDDSKSIIKRKWVLNSFDEEFSFKDKNNYDFKCLGVDFAFSDRVTADKSAFVGIGKVEDKYDIMHCLVRKGMSITEQFDFIEYIAQSNQFSDCALEENSIRSMSNELKRWTFPHTLFWTAAADPKAEGYKKQVNHEFEGKRHTVGKVAMIKRLATQFENKRIRIPYKTEKDKKLANMILDECCTYALADGKLVEVGPHGDIPIALALAIERCEMEVFEFAFGIA